MTWSFGFLIGFLPLMGWHNEDYGGECYFPRITSRSFLLFLWVPNYLFPNISLIVIYSLIFCAIKGLVSFFDRFENKIRSLSFFLQVRTSNSTSRDREVKATKRLTMIVALYMLSTLPLKVVNFLNSAGGFSIRDETLIKSLIILTHLKPSFNPLLYAYHLKDFRQALLKLFGLKKSSQSYELQQVQLRISANTRFGKDISKTTMTSVVNISTI